MNSQDHEHQRIEALGAARLLDAETERAFDRLTELAAQALDAPVSLISLVSDDRQFFLSQCGLSGDAVRTRGSPLSHSFCKHVVWNCTPLVIADARANPLLADNPAVKELPVIAYAGVPIVDGNGYCLGSLCVVDRRPRRWQPEQINLLRSLARQAMTEIELRNRHRRLSEELDAARRVEADRHAMNRLTIHDLRTPLGALMLTLEMIGNFGPLTAEQRELLDLSVKSSKTLEALVNDLLDYEAVGVAGVDGLNRQTCDPYALANLAIEQVSPLAWDKRIQIEREFEPDVPFFSGDARKLSRLLVNLLANAVKFTASDGHITVRISRSQAPAGVCFEVVDTGVGFDMKHAEDLFQEGFRLDKSRSTHESTGFGLAFCKRIAEAHGGRIAALSEKGKGSSFRVTLPVA